VHIHYLPFRASPARGPHQFQGISKPIYSIFNQFLSFTGQFLNSQRNPRNYPKLNFKLPIFVHLLSFLRFTQFRNFKNLNPRILRPLSQQSKWRYFNFPSKSHFILYHFFVTHSIIMDFRRHHIHICTTKNRYAFTVKPTSRPPFQ